MKSSSCTKDSALVGCCGIIHGILFVGTRSVRDVLLEHSSRSSSVQEVPPVKHGSPRVAQHFPSDCFCTETTEVAAACSPVQDVVCEIRKRGCVPRGGDAMLSLHDTLANPNLDMSSEMTSGILILLEKAHLHAADLLAGPSFHALT